MAFTVSRSVRIDHTQVAGDLVDFPFLFAGTYAYLATVANGGDVTNANGYDIGFFSDAALTTPLSFDLDEYDAATGAVALWVLIPSLSASVDTTIYLASGDASITTDQSTPTDVWPNDGLGTGYRLILHLPDSAKQLTDSGFFGYDATAIAAPGAVAAQIASGLSLNGTTQYLTASGTFLSIAGHVFLSMWFYPTSLVAGTLLQRVSNFLNYKLGLDSSGHLIGGANTRDFAAAVSSVPLTLNAWNFLQAGWDGGIGNAKGNFVILNGVKTTSGDTYDGGGYTNAGDLYVGANATPTAAIPGRLDEVRITSIVPSQDWIDTEYNNQIDPSLFYSIGPDSSLPYVISIDGIDENPLLDTFNISAPLNGVATMHADFDSNGSPIFMPDLDAEIIMTEFGVRIFGGYITALRLRGFEGPNGADVVCEITASDYKLAAQWRIVNEIISDPGSPGLVLKDLLLVYETYLTAYGITLDPAQVDGPSVDPVVHVDRSLKDILDELSIITGYVWDIDEFKVFRMYAIGSVAAPFDLDESDLPANYFGDITVEPTREQYANRIYLRYGPDGDAETTDYLFGNGVVDTFTLSAPIVNYVLNSVGRGYVRYSFNSSPYTDETLDLAGQGATWVYDPSANTVQRVSGAPAAGVISAITYIGKFPQTIMVEDAAEIALHQLKELVVPAVETRDLAVATSLAQAELAKHTTVLKRVTFTSRETDLKPGQTLSLISPLRGLNTLGVITEVVTEAEPGGDLLVRRVTALEGEVVQGDWRDLYRRWIAGA